MSKDKDIEKLQQWQGEEETSPELDQNILAMAEQHLKQKEQKAAGGSWWHRLRVPVSVAAGLLVTLGVARLMVNLSGEDMNNMAQVASSKPLEERYAIEMDAEMAYLERERQKQEQVNAQAKRESKQRMLAAPAAPQEPVLEFEPPKVSDMAEESIVVTGSRIRAVDLEQAEPVTVIDGEIEQTSGFDEHGVLDEAVLGYPLPEVWIEEIEQALEAGDEITALDEWGQFKRTYPEYEVDEKLLKRIKTLQKLRENP
ncbi:hypothetical protein [Kangiella koreensis]|uniref:Uncharacterized protein n=1 Tax=Kangiella koreensis (strain DSM 16069 / JCM 12317 / KCTC 12182 / SW-125) TaxID=523791 RepID=C7R7E9_KANKD|nr:hypothetical protein [Kangiella koreensis]ACV25698.1 hypothetical protein Kkor_0277 [Kangiella koreensis DSM 16069]